MGSEAWLSIEEVMSHGIQGWQKQGGGSPLQVAERECGRKEEVRSEVSFTNSKGCGETESGFFFSGGQGALSWFYSQKMTLSRGHFTDVILVTIGGWVVLR